MSFTLGKNERALRHRVMKLNWKLELIMKEEFSVTWWKLKPADELRVLRLFQWQEKYKVPVKLILQILVPIWKKKFARYQLKGFGVTMATLLGPKSESIFVQYVRQQFPDGEHIQRWRAAEQNRQWNFMQEERTRIKWEFPIQAIYQYRKRMTLQQAEFRKFSQAMKRRKYRGNPWL